MADRFTSRSPVLLLNGEIDVRIWIGFPTLALQHPARLASAACIAAARHHIGESPVGILGILFQIADSLESQLVAQFYAAQVENCILHCDRDLLAPAGFLTANQGSQDANRQMHSAVAVTQSRAANCRRTIPEAGSRSGAARALR